MTTPYASTPLTLAAICTCLLTPGWLTGCGERQPSPLQTVLAEIDRVNAGFVPGAERTQTTFAAYRVSRLNEAESRLPSGGLGEGERAATALLRSEIAVSEARLMLQANRAQAAEVLTRASVLGRYAKAAGDAAATVGELRRDDTDLISALQDRLGEVRSRFAQLQRERERIEQQRSSLDEQRQDAAGEARRLVGEADGVDQRAFVAEGESFYELADRAAELRRRAAVALARADTLTARIEALEADIARVDKRATLAEQEISDIQRQLSAAQRREQDRTEALAEARSRLDSAVQTLGERLNAVATAGQEQLLVPFGQAVARFETAAELASTAQSGTRGPEATAVRLARLDRLVSLAGALATEAKFADRLASMLETAANAAPAPATQGEAMESTRSTVQSARETADRCAQRFAEVAQEASTLADELGGSAAEGSPEAGAVNAAREALAAQRELLPNG